MRSKNNLVIVGSQIIFLLFLTVSCNSKEKNEKPIEADFDTNTDEELIEPLINWEVQFISEDDESMTPYYKNREEFIQKYTTYKLLSKDTLDVSTLFEVNGCGEHVPFIEVSGDSIQLHIRHKGKLCMHSEFEKYNYRIVLENVDQYTIIY